MGISIHALCEEGDIKQTAKYDPAYYISIHALCEEGDERPCASSRSRHISIHALCEEGDEQLAYRAALDAKFLSTPSARRATCTYQTPIRNKEISIHALCEEGDPRLHTRVQISTYFYPRPLRGGRLLQDCP